MKKGLITFLTISLLLITSTSIATISNYFVRQKITMNSLNYIETNDYVLIDNSEVSFSINEYLAQRMFNQSLVFEDYISLAPINDFNGGFLTIGAIKNATLDSHGLLQYLFVNQAFITPQVEIQDFFTNETILESEYLSARNIISSFDGSTNHSIIFALKHIITSNEFMLDVFTVDSLELNYLSTINLPSGVYSNVKDFCTMDVDNDKIAELYIIGENASDSTKHIITEYTYNQTLLKYENSTSLDWLTINQNELHLETLEQESEIVFVISSINTTEVNTILTSITLNRFGSRSFTFKKTIQLDFGSNIFRVYGLKKINQNSQQESSLVFFGTLIETSNTYAAYCRISFLSDDFTVPILRYIAETPTWSLDGLISDLDLNGIDDIVLLTYDLLGTQNSDYVIFDGETNTQIKSEQAELKDIQYSCEMKNSEIAIGSWVGKDITNVLTIQFYNTQHIPFRIKNTGEVLLENSVNNLLVISNNLLDNPINRLDYNLSVKFDSHPELVNNYNPPITLQLNVYAIEENQVDDYLLINVLSGSNIIQHIILPVTIAKELDISLILPAEPILSREFPNKEAYFTIKFSNIFDFNINYNISSVQVSEASDAYNQTLDGVVAPDLTKEIDFAVTIDYQKNSYVSFLEVYMNSTVGSYIIDTEITIRPTNQFITNDLIIILFSVIGVSFLSFILLLLYFKAITKSKIKNHIEKDETLELDLKLLENYAIKELYNEYIDSKNWGYGLKLCDEYLQGVSVRFHDMRAKDLLLKGQKEASDGKFHEALMNWEGAKESLEVIGEHQWLDTIDWLLEPLQKIVEIKQSMKGDKKAGALQKEFNVLSGMQEQDKSIMGISLSIPLFIIAEELGLAYKDVNDLQNSLTYLQFAYQYAPDKMKSKIIQEITALIGLGVVPRELAVPIDQKVVQERLASRKIRCYNCGEERTNVKDVCPNCGLETITCSVCKLPITFGAETSQCPSCENIAHREHLLEWTKVKGSCPICQAPLKTVDIDKSSSEVENVE